MDMILETKLQKYLTLITSSSDTAKINEAWNDLIQFSVDNGLSNLIHIVKSVLNDGVKNIYETPKLLEFFARTFNNNPFEVINGTLEKKISYTIFLKCIIGESKDLNLLCNIIEKLMNYRHFYLLNYESIGDFCKAIVHCLSMCSMSIDSTKISEFKDKTMMVYTCLSDALNMCETKEEYDKLLLICTETVYKLIIESHDNKSIPGAALAIVIRLIEPQSIHQFVHLIIDKSPNEVHLSQLIFVLCKWLTQWLNDDTLFVWIEKFIEHLRNERRYSVLNSVSNNCLRLMLKNVLLPVGRCHAMPLLHIMLIHMTTRMLFHKNIKYIEVALYVLRRDRSPLGIKYTQDLADCVCALMTRFPGSPFYESLNKYLPLEAKHDTVMSLVNAPQWIDNDTLVIKTHNWASNNNKRVGLNNLGNTCYMNSVLQALVMTPKFCNQILAYDEHSIGKNCILHELQRLFALLLYSQRTCLSPTDFFRASRPTYFTPGQQHDSAEFLCHLLDVLYEQEISTMAKSKMSNAAINDKSLNNSEQLKLQSHTIINEDNNSNDCDTRNCSIQSNDNSNSSSSLLQSCLVYRMFGGESNTTYHCTQCYTSSHNNDHYWELQLSFPEDITANCQITIEDLIKYYLTPEKLTGDNMYHCDRCNSLCDAQRVIKVLRAPAHLILTLKHFHYNIDSRLKTKLFHKVNYNETIQIPVLNDDYSNDETYQLYAAVVHSGYSMDYGHYFTYARDRTKKWYKFNDSYVVETSLNEFFQLQPPCTPYILFYEKISDNLEYETDDKPTLARLSKSINKVLAMDMEKYQSEQKNFIQNRLTQVATDDSYQISTSRTRQRDNSDDDNPPPTNCRDSLDRQVNRFLY